MGMWYNETIHLSTDRSGKPFVQLSENGHFISTNLKRSLMQK